MRTRFGRTLAIAAGLLAATGLSACISARPPLPPSTAMIKPVEDQKKDIALMRERGEIGFAEATRRQYAIQRASYSLSPGEVAFWEYSVSEASKVDTRQITRNQFFQRRDAAYARYVRA